MSRALIGDLIGIRAKALGVGGFVIDGAVRDADAMAELELPVFARAVTPAGPYKHGPGRLQQPVAIAGVVVLPGDILVADADGVVDTSKQAPAKGSYREVSSMGLVWSMKPA